MFYVIFLCNSLPIFLGGLVLYYVAADVVSMQPPRAYIWGACSISTMIWIINQYVLTTESSAMDLISCLFPVFSILPFAPKGRKLQGAVTMVALLAVQTGLMFTIGYIAFPLAKKLGYAYTELFNNTTSFGSAIMCFIMLFLGSLAYYLTGRLMIYLFQGGGLSSMLLCFLPIPISQTILVNIINRVLPTVHGVDGIMISYALAILLAIVAAVAFLVGVQKIRQVSQLREQVRCVSQQLDVQTGYYRQLQESILTVNQIRHDLNNQLQAAYHLLESGETALARRQLDQVQDSLHQQVGTRFSSNLMVDAVLQDKANACRNKGISLTVNAEIPPELSIENAHLCSVFSNLLDNSIHGALESGAADKGITLHAAVRNNCLIIRCNNPACKPERSQSRDPLRLHGLGLEILNKIASQYNGSVNTEYKDGWFYASVCLPLSRTLEGDSMHVN